MFAFANLRLPFRETLLRMAFASLLAACFFSVMPLHAAENLPEIQQLLRQGQNSQALEKVNAYLETRPNDAQGRFLKGLILTELKRHNEAIAIFTKLTEDYPELPEPYNNLAVLYAHQKQYDRARTALEMAIRTHPSYAVAYENLGDVYAKLASQAYDKALQLDTSNAAAQGKLALIRDLVGPPASLVARSGQQTLAQAEPKPQPQSQPKQTAAQSPAQTSRTTTPPAERPAADVKPIADADNDAAAINKVIAAWAAAWSQQDVKAYLEFYSPTFKTPKGMSRKAWEDERRARITRPDWIKVEYDAPGITVDGNQATARFQQRYQASNFKSDSRKTLTFIRLGRIWLIVSEESN
ncbi:MAG: tetratricopeptide repeat protein [Betaproteobacteria bacterium]|nr:tetratricopeptide repeat protein [Betaproteobacteria bacterium]